MKSINFAEAIYANQKTNTANSLEEHEEQRSCDFEEIMRKLEAMQESPAERTARNKREAEAALEQKRRSSKIGELRGLIAALNTKLISSGYSKAVEAELSAAQHQLYWLLMGL